MPLSDQIAEARKQGRAALDELAGKQLLAAFGIAVPKSLMARDATEAAAACS
jgi:acyl-CoA synthetase (NDP forming)